MPFDKGATVLAHPSQKSTCTNHRAITQANAHSDDLDATGIGACACSRHGCFVPHCVVDFQKGERYVGDVLLHPTFSFNF
jgi:hypothetical protein